MCGIWALINNTFESDIAFQAFQKIKSRGPDRSSFTEYSYPYNFSLGFHRLAIINPTLDGDQPFKKSYEDREIFVICNGEIYNYEEIKRDIDEEYGCFQQMRSDCEIILHAYEYKGINYVLKSLRGEYAFIIFDYNKSSDELTVYAACDQFCIRPMFISYDEKLSYINFSSELKGLAHCENQIVEPMKPFHCLKIVRKGKEMTKEYFKYYEFPSTQIFNNLSECCEKIVETLTKSVEKRLMTDRPIASLLSGGIDSSLVSAIAAKKYNGEEKLKTFCVGMPNSTDKDFAQIVANHIGSNHTYVELPHEIWLNAIPNVIRIIESYDITTVRASVGQYLISEWIAKNTDIKVLLVADGSDELVSGYKYFHKAPSPSESHQENLKLLEEISLYDVRRCDRCISGNGLEARVPFLDIDFVNLYLEIDETLRVPKNNQEKWLLREAFRETNLLPNVIINRPKEALSDGVSGQEKSWYQIIQDHIETIYSDKEFEEKRSKYEHNVPVSKESLYYREIFEEHYGKNNAHIIPHFWLPNWSNGMTEPSARALSYYK
jgi:asparagine synthase (glutamine-hydrolysing)